jgi:hypothetical protein
MTDGKVRKYRAAKKTLGRTEWTSFLKRDSNTYRMIKPEKTGEDRKECKEGQIRQDREAVS